LEKFGQRFGRKVPDWMLVPVLLVCRYPWESVVAVRAFRELRCAVWRGRGP